MLGVCNGPRIAGGTPLAPGALPDDGLADVVVCTATGPVARAAFAAALLGGSHPDRPDVWTGRGRRASFRGSPHRGQRGRGGAGWRSKSRTWRVEHHAWSVLVPS